MSYTINPNAKNRWARNAENTMDLSLETDASSVYLDNGRTLEQEIGEGSMVSNVATVDSGMEKVIDDTYDGAYESCKMYGKSLVNLMTKEIDTTWNLNLTNWSIVSTSPSDFILKPNTTYSVIVYVTEKTCSDRDDLFWVGDIDGGKNKITHDIVRKNVSLGTNVFVINTVSDFSNLPSTKGGIGFQGSKFVEGTLKWKVIVLEGDWTDKELPPYFTGLCDVKAPILKNVGKNILPKETGKWYSCYFKKGTTFQLTTKDNNPSKGGNIVFVDGSDTKVWMGIDSGVTKKTYTLPNDAHKISNQLASGVEYQLEININATPYEDYKTNILETSNDIVLRGLPNGVKDSYDCLTGEYVQRIGEVVYNNTNVTGFYVSDSYQKEGCTTFMRPVDETFKKEPKMISNLLPFLPTGHWNDVDECLFAGTVLVIRLKSTKASNVTELQEYLSQHPLVVQYELAEPITTTIEPPTTPFAYQNGHIILESGHEGQSLLPMLEYSTVINKTGQIENVAKTIQRQEKQLTMLEKMLIQNIINLDYNNTLLTLKNEMEEML